MRELHHALDRSDLALLREDILNPYYEQRLQRQIEDEFITRLVAWHNEKIVASLALHRKRPRWLQHTSELRAISHPDYRRFGITIALMEEAIPFARQKGIPVVSLKSWKFDDTIQTTESPAIAVDMIFQQITDNPD